MQQKQKNKPTVRLKWVSREIDIKKIKPTPTNYKIKSDLGRERLTRSLELFGIAGNVVCNSDFTLIDGNSRLEQAKERGERKLWVSLPNRKLTVNEFKEMSALFDYAQAGEVDIERIKGDLGNTKQFYERWGIKMSDEVLKRLGSMGSKAELVQVEGKNGKSNGKANSNNGVGLKDELLINLFFTSKQEAEFRKMEEKLSKRFKAESTSDLVFKVFKSLCR